MLEELRQIRELLGRLRQDPVAWIAALVCPDHLIPILIILAAGGFVPLVGIDRYRVPLLAASSVVFVAIALWPLWRQLRQSRQGTEGSRRMPVWAVLVTGAIGLLVSSLGWRAVARRRSLRCPAWLSRCWARSLTGALPYASCRGSCDREACCRSRRSRSIRTTSRDEPWTGCVGRPVLSRRALTGRGSSSQPTASGYKRAVGPATPARMPPAG